MKKLYAVEKFYYVMAEDEEVDELVDEFWKREEYRPLMNITLGAPPPFISGFRSNN